MLIRQASYPGLSRHLLMNGDTTSRRSHPGEMADGIPGFLSSLLSVANTILLVTLSGKRIRTRVWNSILCLVPCLQRDVFGFCRLQGDSLAPAGAEEEPAPHVPEQAVPDVTCEWEIWVFPYQILYRNICILERNAVSLTAKGWALLMICLFFSQETFKPKGLSSTWSSSMWRYLFQPWHYNTSFSCCFFLLDLEDF